MTPQRDYLSSVKYDNLANLPAPPVEEVVEPHSFRNNIIKMLCCTALIPIFMLGLFQSQQIQRAMESADDAQLAMARNIAENIRLNVEAGRRVLQVLADVHGFDRDNARAVQAELDRFVRNSSRSTLAAAAIFDSNDALIAFSSRLSDSQSALLKKELTKLAEGVVSQGGAEVLRIEGLPSFVAVCVRQKGETSGKGRLSLGLYTTEFVEKTLRVAIGEHAFDGVVVDAQDLTVAGFNDASSDNGNQALIGIAESRAKLKEDPSGYLTRTAGTRDVAQIKAYASVRTMGWTVALSEPLKVRDRIMLASLETSGFFLLLAVALTFIVGSLMHRPLSRSVNTLMRAVEQFGRTGRFHTIQKQLEKDGVSELTELGQTFEQMVGAVSEGRKKLERLNASLEDMVNERTVRLLGRNSELRALQRLLLPLQDADTKRGIGLKSHVAASVDQFGLLLGLPDLTFTAATETGQPPAGKKVLMAVELSGVTYGWLTVRTEPLLTTDRVDSLRRLANSLAIVLANDTLVRQLAKEHATLAAVFESMTDGVVIRGKSGRIIYANEYACRLLNDGAGLVGISGRELTEKRYGTEMPEGSSFSHVRLVRRTAQGVTQTLDVTGFVVSDLPGFPGERSGWLIRDISREAGLDAMKENLVSVVAHELKTPVTALRLLASNIAHGVDGDRKERESDAAELVDETLRLGQLIDDLLDVSRIEGGVMRLDKKVVQIASLIDRAARLTRARYPIVVERVIEADAEAVCVDPARFTQILINLFVNAARYKKPGEETARCKVSVHLSKDGRVCVDVTDFGCGMDSDRLTHIFEPFYQGDMTKRRAAGGAGLGLTIVKGIVEAHNGTVSVRSTPGVSTTFTVSIPV
ncbi:ATP-binding protein [Duodenibacillus massiliensis]|uniref:sensor histidine kinase n=1 Tax=Duodenibacillus massiliensis TaxID=1852381 RepID=UPI003AF1A34A